jgi:hypothetical protein
MKALKTLAVTFAALAALAAPGLAHEPAGSGSSQDALVGTWDLVLTFGDGTKVKSTLSVLPGRSHGEGSVIHAAEASLLLPNPTTPEQGAWVYKGNRLFLASYRGFAVDSNFANPAGRIGFRHRIRVSKDQRSFVGTALFEVLDVDGTVLFTDTIQTSGRRQVPLEP